MNCRKCHPKGFTLIEVLLALAIIAIALTALLSVTGGNIQQTQRLKETMIQHWVAEQALHEIQLGLRKVDKLSTTTYKTKWLNQNCYWQIKSMKTKYKNIRLLLVLTSTKQSGPFNPTLSGYWMTT